jgi:hypothetical protein
MVNTRPLFINAENFTTPQHSRLLFTPSHKMYIHLMGQCYPIWVLMVNIKMAHNETGLTCVDWIQLAEERDNLRSHVHMALNVQVSNMQLISQLRHAVAQWLKHCATNRKAAGWISDSVSGIFHLHNPSGHTMALGLTQPLTEMNTRNISWG